MEIDKLNALQCIQAGENILDKLADAQGRAKCGYIYVLSELFNKLKQETLIMEERIRESQKSPDEQIQAN